MKMFDIKVKVLQVIFVFLNEDDDDKNNRLIIIMYYM